MNEINDESDSRSSRWITIRSPYQQMQSISCLAHALCNLHNSLELRCNYHNLKKISAQSSNLAFEVSARANLSQSLSLPLPLNFALQNSPWLVSPVVVSKSRKRERSTRRRCRPWWNWLVYRWALRFSSYSTSTGLNHLFWPLLCFIFLMFLSLSQTAFVILDEVIRMTNRRVNAIEHVIIPRLENTISVSWASRTSLHRNLFRFDSMYADRTYCWLNISFPSNWLVIVYHFRIGWDGPVSF